MLKELILSCANRSPGPGAAHLPRRLTMRCKGKALWTEPSPKQAALRYLRQLLTAKQQGNGASENFLRNLKLLLNSKKTF